MLLAPIHISANAPLCSFAVDGEGSETGSNIGKIVGEGMEENAGEEKKEGSMEEGLAQPSFNTSTHTLGEPKKSKMGPTAFTEFCKELVEITKEDAGKGKELMRRRTQQAMIESSK
jgi:hypothetical protein